jgi:hypothetical protein
MRTRDRAGPPRVLVRDLGQAVAAGGLVDVDDRNDNGAPHPGADACLLQVVRGGDEELRGRLLVGRRARGRVDDDLDLVQGRIKPRASDDVHARRARYRHDLVAAFGKNLADVPPESSGRSGNCDLHDVLLHDGVVTAMTEHRRVR